MNPAHSFESIIIIIISGTMRRTFHWSRLEVLEGAIHDEGVSDVLPHIPHSHMPPQELRGGGGDQGFGLRRWGVECQSVRPGHTKWNAEPYHRNFGFAMT